MRNILLIIFLVGCASKYKQEGNRDILKNSNQFCINMNESEIYNSSPIKNEDELFKKNILLAKCFVLNGKFQKARLYLTKGFKLAKTKNEKILILEMTINNTVYQNRFDRYSYYLKKLRELSPIHARKYEIAEQIYFLNFKKVETDLKNTEFENREIYQAWVLIFKGQYLTARSVISKISRTNKNYYFLKLYLAILEKDKSAIEESLEKLSKMALVKDETKYLEYLKSNL